MVWKIRKSFIKKILPRSLERGKFIVKKNSAKILIKFNKRTAMLQRIKQDEPSKVESITVSAGNDEYTIPPSGSA
jgi:hypothetical protein